MKTKILIAILTVGIFSISTINAQEKAAMKMDHSKMKKDTAKMEIKAMYSCPMKCEGDKKYEKPGNCPKCKMDLKKTEMKPVYTCSMHPEVSSDKQGECSKCGMKLIEKKMEMKKEKEDSHKGHNH